MKPRSIALLSLAALMAVCLPALAHHGAAAYNNTETVLKDAKVTKYTWANPHTIIEFDAKNDKGAMVHWAGELGSPSAIGNQGWTKASVAPGDVITVYIHLSKSGNPVGRITHIVMADGTSLRDSSGTSGTGGRGGRGGGEDQN